MDDGIQDRIPPFATGSAHHILDNVLPCKALTEDLSRTPQELDLNVRIRIRTREVNGIDLAIILNWDRASCASAA